MTGASATAWRPRQASSTTARRTTRWCRCSRAPYPEVDGRDGRGDARGQSAAHHPDLRGRHRHDDGVRQGDQARVRGDGGAGEKFDPKAYVPAVAGYYSTPDGRMLSFPFNSSTVVFYYNKDAFKKAGLDPNNPPKTWPAVTAAAISSRSRARSAATPPAGRRVQLRDVQRVARHAVLPGQNGFEGSDARLRDRQPAADQAHRQPGRLVQEGYFTCTPGRTNEGEAKFYSGECPMMTSSSAAYANVKRNAKFDWGTSRRPVLPGRAHRRTPSSAARRCG